MDQIISSKSSSSDSKTSESNGKLHDSSLSSSRHQFFECIVSNIILIGDTDFKKLQNIWSMTMNPCIAWKILGAFHLVKNSENSGSGLNGKRFFGSPN